MPKHIYQVHVRTEAIPDNEYHAVDHYIFYVIGESKEEAISESVKFAENDERYALRVGNETIEDEIAHCGELIAYWQSDESKQEKYRDRHLDVILGHQRSKIKFYQNLLEQFNE